MKRLKEAEICDGWKAYGLSCIMSKRINVSNGVVINENDIKKILAGNTAELEQYLSDIRIYNDMAVRVSIGCNGDEEITYKGIFKSKFGIPYDMEKLTEAIKHVSDSAKKKMLELNINSSLNIIIQNMIYDSGLCGFAYSDAVDETGNKVIRIEVNEECSKKALPGSKTSSVVTVDKNEILNENAKIKIHGKVHDYSKMIKLARIVYRAEKYLKKPVLVEWCIINKHQLLIHDVEPMADDVKIMNIFCQKKQTCVSVPYTFKPYLQLTEEIEEHKKEIKRSKEEELEFNIRVSKIRNRYASLKKGDIFEFGSYNGKKIEWIVLDIKSDRVYILCQSYLCEKPFDESEVQTNIWEQCTLRKWLNDQFYRLAFDNAEKECIKEVNSDKITLLTKEEVEPLQKSINFFEAWTRTPHYTDSKINKSKLVYIAGLYPIAQSCGAVKLNFDVCPALYLKL